MTHADVMTYGGTYLLVTVFWAGCLAAVGEEDFFWTPMLFVEVLTAIAWAGIWMLNQ